MVSAPETKQEQKPVNGEVLKKDISKEEIEDKEEMEVEIDPVVKAEKSKKAKEKLCLGKRALSMNDPHNAVEHLADACGIMAEVVGDLSLEMCEFQFQYGKALLELARVEEGVLGNALQGVPDESGLEDSQIEDPDKLTPEEKEEVAEKVEQAFEENLSATKKDDETATKKDDETATKKDDETATKKDDETATKKDDETATKKADETAAKKDESEKSADKVEKSPVKESESVEDSKSENKDAEDSEDKNEEMETDEKDDENDSDAESQEESQDEDVGSLQLAFEVLETCKTMYLKVSPRSEEMDLKLSQVYLKLGEVAMENEMYGDSVNEFKQCLSIQEKFLASDDRLVAETHYNLCIANTFNNTYDDAIKHAESAVQVIKSCISKNKDILKEKGIELTADTDISALKEHKSVAKEVRELEKLLPEMEEKLTDVKEAKISCAEKLKSLKEGIASALSAITSPFEASSGASTSAAAAKPINTSLIKKRRKPEDEVESGEPSKKAKTDSEESNGKAEKDKSDNEKKTE